MTFLKEESTSGVHESTSGYRSSGGTSNSTGGGSSGLTMRSYSGHDSNSNGNSNSNNCNNNNNSDNNNNKNDIKHSNNFYNLNSSRPRSGDFFCKSGGEYEYSSRSTTTRESLHKISTSSFTTTTTSTTTATNATPSPSSATRVSGSPGGGGGTSTLRRGGSQNKGKFNQNSNNTNNNQYQYSHNSPVQKRRRANLLRVRIERGLMVGMAFLAGYRMMTLDYNTGNSVIGNSQDQSFTSSSSSSSSPTSHRSYYQQQQQQYRKDTMPLISKNAWTLGAGFILLALTHALFLFAYDNKLQFPIHNKNLPLQPLRKRSSRYLNTNLPHAATATVIAADSDDDTEDDDALYKEITAEIQQENLQFQQQDGVSNGNGGISPGGIIEPPLGSWQSRFCRSAEVAMPQWRIWGSEAHWYRKGADNGSIFATLLVPVVLAAKFVQTVSDKKFLSTGENGIRTAESVLSNMAFSLIFGVSILVHMLLLKLFDQIGSGPKSRHDRKKGLSVQGLSVSSIIDTILPPPTMIGSSAPSSSMSNNNLSSLSNGGQYPNGSYSSSRHNISSPSSPPSPSLSATSSASRNNRFNQHHQQHQQQDVNDAYVYSGEQLHYMEPSECEKASDREEIWIIALGFGGAFTCIITLLARFKWIPGLENTGAGMVMLNQNMFQVMMIGFSYFFKRSFTFGELVILSQVITLLIHETLILTFVTPSPAPGTVFGHPQFMFLLALVVGMLLIGVMLTPVLMYCRRLAQTPTKGASLINLQKREFKKKVSAGIVYAGFISIVLGIIMPICQRILGQNPFLWLIEFMLMTRIFSPTPKFGGQPDLSPLTDNSSPMAASAAAAAAAASSSSLAGSLSSSMEETKFSLETLMGARVGWSRLGLCSYWIFAITCSIAFFYWMNSSIHRKSIMGSLNNRRKYYHALAVIMFVPGYLADEPFMHLAFSVGLAALIFLEYIRYFAVMPFGKEIHLFLIGFLDARDGGPIILSHLYLLIGCATPVWLAEHHILAGLSGIFALGVGDAMASIVGKRFGKHRWPGTIKTVEGTIAFIVSVMMAAGAVFVGMWLMSFVFGGHSLISRSTSSSSSPSASSSSSSSPSLSSSVSGGLGPKTASLPPASLLSFSTWSDWSSVTWSIWGVIRYGVAISISAMLEAVSEQNDNLVIPVVMLSMVWLI